MKVGLVGKPNAGKSTFFNAVTSAVAQIGDYPFTTIDKKIIIDCHSIKIFSKGICINLIKTAIPAIFGTIAKKLVIEEGEPSKTSGVHI